jgi:hypothetical protein
MNSLFGITGIQVRIIEVTHDHTEELNAFLEEYDGDIISIQPVGMMYGVCKFIITYKAIER